MLGVYISSKTIDVIQVGLNRSKMAMIITNREAGIMEKIELLYSETKHMLAQIKGAPESDELVQAIEDFLKKRDGLIREIKPPLSETEKRQLQQVTDMEPLIMAELKRLQQAVKQELLQYLHIQF